MAQEFIGSLGFYLQRVPETVTLAASVPFDLKGFAMQPSHVASSFDDAYKDYVADMKRAHDENVGFVPLDRILFRQPLAQMISSLLFPVQLSKEDKIALVMYHYTKHGIGETITANEIALMEWLVGAGNEHAQVIETLDSRPDTLKIYGPNAKLILHDAPSPKSLMFHFEDMEIAEQLCEEQHASTSTPPPPLEPLLPHWRKEDP